jgi:hypothetical protein
MNYTHTLRTLRHVFAGLAVIGVFTLASTARASSITYTLTQDGCTGGCGTAPYGTITLTDDTSLANTVDVSETLLNGDEFVRTGNHDSLTFNTDVTPITISNLTTGYTQDSSPSNPPFDPFGFGISCTGCGPGASSPLGGTLAFDVTGPAGFSISDFVANANGDFFASDIIGTTGNTGAVAALAASSVPEPSQTLLLLALMLVGFVAMRRTKLRSTR